MALRRGDWETGDVICHECHLTAPPTPPPPPPTHPHLPPHPRLSLSLARRSSTSSFLFLFFSPPPPPPLCVYFPRRFAVMIYLNAPPGHLSSSSRALSLSLAPSPRLDITSISPRPVFTSAAAAAALFPT